MPGKIKLLIVDDEECLLDALSKCLGSRDFEVTCVDTGQFAIQAAGKLEFEVALVDLKMPGIPGERVLEILKQKDPYIEIVILTGHGSVDSAVECTKLGCFGYLQKPCETEELRQMLENAYRSRVMKKLRFSEERMEQLLNGATGKSPLGILRRLRELEKNSA